MQFKTLLAAFGLAAVATAAALPEPVAEPELVERAASAPFKIRRFTPGPNFNPAVDNTWSNNQYVNIASAQQYLNYDGVTEAAAYKWTFDPATGYLRGSASGSSGLAARNLQSYGIPVTPISFGGVGEVVKVSIGPAPLNEITFNTVRSDNPVSGWNGLSQIGGSVFLGKASAIESPIRFRAIGYVAPA